MRYKGPPMTEMKDNNGKVHLLMKNMSACCAGGLMFWALGWAFCMGEGQFATPFNGL